MARFSKGLDHDPTTGEVNASQFQLFVDQLKKLNADPGQVAKRGFQLRSKTCDSLRRFVNPQSGWALDTEVTDPCCYVIPEPPDLNSQEEAAEMIELYWMALLRDVPFAQWDDHPLVAAAAEELSTLPLFINRDAPNENPTNAGFEVIPITSKSLFRGGELARFADQTAGISESIGPYLSQFLLHEIPYGTLRIPQRCIHAASGIDYMTEWSEWLHVQDGERRNPNQNLVGQHDPSQRRYLSTMRDLATYVHYDALYEAYLNAALILLGSGYPTNPGNPYGPGCSVMGTGQDQRPHDNEAYLKSADRGSPKYPDQDGFGTFGGPQVLSQVTEVATRALKAVWRQKWTHLRLRPEAYSGLVHRAIVDGVPVPYEAFDIEVERILRASCALDRLTASRGKGRSRHRDHDPSALLPMAFPEGSPTHPSYGAGHATVAGACVTVLKAFFDGTVQFIGPVEATADGQHLVPYQGMDAHSGKMTVELELNKLAANIAIGRNMAGVHWRSDYTQSVLLGQRVAVDMLYRKSATYTEDYCIRFNSFGGKPIEIQAGQVKYAGKKLSLPELKRGECLEPERCNIANELKSII
ncbi:vanadium-dependent haloperoxidase [Planctomycetes bacterium TBK1r]|uniref:PAP2 superfamily protein n=1 Tax=Stieleria magnilauensis TaxID=2527963 RepID=A0ABX5XJ62_9BACT|nr:PAP2 superfamily protein [Planctomycetes bacterium TBK1r]